ncbi:MAG: sigma-70 family RNA polymerase sigma factor [Chitinophagaceae bacterium]|nr:sigma-70 family RNA polymerase sigma factor [Chitinophagaceae bacterium]
MQKLFYYEYYALLMRIGIRYAPSREDAEQWVHDGFLKIFASLSTYRHLGSFEGWIRKIMVRLCIDQLRAHNTGQATILQQTVSEDQGWEEAHYVDNDFTHKTSAEELLRMIGFLPDRQKLVFNLIVFEDYSHKEVAGLLQITETHAYLLLHQARKLLKNMIQKRTEPQNVSYEQR